MLIYGSKAVHLKSVQSKTATCQSCGTKGSIVLSVYRKHAHIFWIPLFPFVKKGVSQCQHCKNSLETKEMPDPLKREYDMLKSDSKGPIWQFSGLAIIVLLIAFGMYNSKQADKQRLIYFESPMEGDVYEYRSESNYTTFKINNISADSIFVIHNDYEINKITKIHTIDKPENYTNLPYGISKGELKELFDSGKIVGINRD